MADNSSFYQKLTRLFRSGPAIRRKIKGQDTKNFYDTAVMQANIGYYAGQASGVGFRRENSPFSILGQYGLQERMARYNEFAEMEYTSEIATALDIYADEACSGDENGRCLHISSENPQIQKALEELFYEVYNIDFEGRRDTRNLVKNGDFFRYVEVVPEHGVILSEPIPVNEVEREEGYDPQDPHAVRFKLLTKGGKYLENWQVLHFRILGNDLMLPYGTSFLESVRRTWRQLVMMEDAMLVYRVVRSPERRVFYIDVSTVASTDVASYMEAVKEQIRGNSIVDKLTGRLDSRNNAVSINDDYFMPTRPNSNTKIETLAGGQHVSATEDVEYIRSKVISGLKVPKAYLGFDESLSCFTPDTKISLLDGRELTMPEIREELLSGKELWTYSMDLKTKAIVPGKVIDSWEAKTTSKLIEVTLDNGEKFKCTPEHKWLNRDGIYVEAQHLEAGTSLMPLYRRITGKDTGKRNLSGYEEVYNPATEKWEYTHKLVDAALNAGKHSVKNRRVVHHIDFNKRNNAPTNLAEMNFFEHKKLHQDLFAETKQKALLDGKYSGLNNGWAKKTFEKIKPLYDIKKLEEWCLANKPKSKRNIISGYGLTETWLDRLILTNYSSYKSFAETNLAGGYQLARKGTGKVSLICIGCGSSFKVSPSGRRTRKHCNEKCRKEHGKRNHKVVSVKAIEQTSPVWDITVEKYHNFALSNGVFVKNSKATLAQEDIRFSRTIVSLQKIMIAELNKLAILHLYAIGFTGEDLLDFKLKFSNPSTVAIQQKLALTSQRFDAAAKAWDLAKETGMVDMEYIQRDILGFTPEEIVQMRIGAEQDQIRIARLKALLERTVKDDNDDQAMVDEFDPSNYNTPGSPIQNLPTGPGQQAAPPVPEDGTKKQTYNPRVRNTQDKIIKKKVTNPSKAPISSNPTPNIDRLKTQGRRSKQFTGNRALNMPDFASMLSVDNRYAKDPYDYNFLKNPLAEEVTVNNLISEEFPRGLEVTLRSALRKFAEATNRSSEIIDVEIISESEVVNEAAEEDELLNLDLEFSKSQ